MKLRKWVIVLMVFLLTMSLTACGGKKNESNKHAGKYTLTDEKFSDGSGEADREWILILEENGKGKSQRDDLDIEVEWSADGEKLK